MACLARALITKSYYLSGIVSRKFQTVDGEQITVGLDLLNDALAEPGITGGLVPYYKEYSFFAVKGQEKYFVPGLVRVENLTFTIDTVRYSMSRTSRNKYFGTGRANNIESLPYKWHEERTLNGADFYLYFLPDTNYPMKIWGKFKLDEVADLCEDLSLVYDTYYLKYLTYAVAEEICEDNSFSLPPATEKELRRLEKKLTNVSPMDLTMKKRSLFQTRGTGRYGWANLGRGFYP